MLMILDCDCGNMCCYRESRFSSFHNVQCSSIVCLPNSTCCSLSWRQPLSDLLGSTQMCLATWCAFHQNRIVCRVQNDHKLVPVDGHQLAYRTRSISFDRTFRHSHSLVSFEPISCLLHKLNTFGLLSSPRFQCSFSHKFMTLRCKIRCVSSCRGERQQRKIPTNSSLKTTQFACCVCNVYLFRMQIANH